MTTKERKMGKFIGAWKLDKPIYCKKEVSGRCFQSSISGVSVSFCFPSCPETYNGIEVNSLTRGDLLAPLDIFREQINWGTIHAWPEGLFSVNWLLCLWYGEESEVQSIYADFPRWKEKFNNLVLIDSGNFIQPESKTITFLQHGNGIYDGLEVFMLEEGKPLKREVNHRASNPIHLQMVSSEQCYDFVKMKLLFENAGSEKEIILPYELLLVAYRAVIRHDFRSAIIIAATALEKSILNRIHRFYTDNQLKTFEKDKRQHKMLANEFRWLNELKIAIPVQDYQTEILNVRNPTVHEGKPQNYNDTERYLDNCKLIIQAYNPKVLEE